MSGKSTTISNIQPVAGNLRVQTAIYGSAIPMVYGRTRISGNLAWYGGFTAIPHTSTQKSGGKGGGGGVTQEDTSFTYSAAVLMCLSRGLVLNVLSGWKGKLQYSGLAAMGLGLYVGHVGQPVWGYLTSAYPSQALAYSGLAYVYASGYDLGADATVTNHSFEVSTPWECVPSGDANTALIAQDILQTARFPTGLVGDYAVWANYVLAQNLVMSPVLTQQKPAADWLRYLLDLSNTEVTWSQGGLKFVPLGDAACSANGASYTPNNTPVYDLTDDHFLIDNPEEDPLKPERKANEDTYNHVRLEFTNRQNQYNVETVEAKDAADIDQRGLRSKDVVEAHAINDPQIAQLLVTLLLQRELAVRNVYRFSLPWTFGLLEPLDLVTVTDAYLSLTRVPVRITSIAELDGGDFELEAEDCPVGMANAPLYGIQAGAGFSHDFNEAPGPVAAPFFFEPPVQLTTTGLEVWAAVAGTSPKWGGCSVWVSTDGISYRQLTSARGGSRFGVLSSSLGVSGADTLGVALAGQGGQLLSASQSDAENNQTLVFVGDQLGGEYLNYQTATLTGTNAYNLTGLLRGAFQSVPQARGAGLASVVRVDDAIVKSGPLEPEMVGQPLYFKFPSVNVYGGGEELLEAVSAYTYTPTGYMLKLPPPDVKSFAISGDGLATWSDVDVPDLAGYQIRWQPGDNTSWGDANPVHAGIITDNPYPIGVRPSGVATFLVKAFDRYVTAEKPFGNESVNAAASVINLGDPVVENVIVTTDYKALGFPAPPNSFITLDAGQYPEYDASDFESFARATSAAYYDVAGVLQSAAADVPRFGYHPTTHAYLGLLIEDAETRPFPHYLKFDGVDDALGTAAFAAGTLTSAMDAFFVVRRGSAGTATLGYDSGATKFFASMESGSAVVAHSNAGTPTYLVNGVAVAGGTATTRGQLHTALAVGPFSILEIRNLDLSTWTDFFTGGLASYRLNGGIAGMVICPAQTNAKRDEIRDYFYNVLGKYRAMYGTAYPGSDALISDLFASGQQGLWPKPSDFATLYQDSAGTTAVTAVEQSVGKTSDKSGRGNHLLQSTSGSRPVVSARMNLVTKSDQFNDASWGKAAGGTGLAPVVTANAALAPDGTMNADRVVFDKGAGATSVDQSRLASTAVVTVIGLPTVAFIWLKSATASSYAMRLDFNGSGSSGSGYPSLITVTPTWQRFEIRISNAADAVRQITLRLRGTLGTDSYADVHVWGAQQENATAPTAYQSINTATDYATIEETRAADACDILTALGGKVNCTVDGSGNLVADADASPLAWDANANTAGWTFDTAPGWTLATFKPMTYRPEVFTVVDADDGAQLTLSNELVGTSSQIEYRRDGDAPGWTIDSEPGWTDDAAPAWVIDAWRAWPGLVTARPGRYEFQVTIQSRDVQGAINALAAVLDVEDQTENVGLVPILAGGTVIPTTKTWRHVDIGLTLVADGGTAETARIEDRATRTVTTRNAANTSVPGTVIATLQGY